MMGTKTRLTRLSVIAVALATLASCQSFWVNTNEATASLPEDQAACNKQAQQETGQYNNTRAFKRAKKRCLESKGWTKQYELPTL
jgi:hypothetical protein